MELFVMVFGYVFVVALAMVGAAWYSEHLDMVIRNRQYNDLQAALKKATY